MKRLVLAITLLMAMAVPAAAAPAGDCSNPLDPDCHSVTGDQAAGDFHGLIMVEGQPDVLDRAAHTGTQPGCGDCVWTLIMMCLTNTPGDGHDQHPCVGVTGAARCKPKQLAFR